MKPSSAMLPCAAPTPMLGRARPQSIIQTGDELKMLLIESLFHVRTQGFRLQRARRPERTRSRVHPWIHQSVRQCAQSRARCFGNCDAADARVESFLRSDSLLKRCGG